MIREDRVNDVVVSYERLLQPENLVPHDVAIGNDKDALRQKYENALLNPNKVFFVGHSSPYTVFDDPDTGEQIGRLTVQDMHDFADEIQAIQNRCPHLQRRPPSIHREDGQALYAEWMFDVPIPQECIQEAVNWLKENAGVMIQRDVMQEAALGHKDYDLSPEQRIEVANRMVALVENEGLNQNGAFRLVKRVAEDMPADMLDALYPVKHKAKPVKYAAIRDGQVYFVDEGVNAPNPYAVKPLPARPPQLRVGGGQEIEDAYQRMQVQLAAIQRDQVLRIGRNE